MHKFIPLALLAWCSIFSCAQRPTAGKPTLQWMTLPEAAIAVQKEKRPILIDLYTDWCGWCKVMDKRTYANKDVIAYLQRNFYPVKLNAETKTVLQWQGKSYTYNAAYKVNEFSMYLTGGQLSFPTTVIIPPGHEPQPVPGYLAPADLELIVKYFGEKKYPSLAFDVYQRSFKASW